MTRLTLTMDLQNAAFEKPWSRDCEVARLLRTAADKIEHNGLEDLTLQDFNGNTVARLEVS